MSKHPQHQPRVHSIFLLVLTRRKLSFPDLNKDGLLQIPEMSKVGGEWTQLSPDSSLSSTSQNEIPGLREGKGCSKSHTGRVTEPEPGLPNPRKAEKKMTDKQKSGRVWGTQMLGFVTLRVENATVRNVLHVLSNTPWWDLSPGAQDHVSTGRSQE